MESNHNKLVLTFPRRALSRRYKVRGVGISNCKLLTIALTIELSWLIGTVVKRWTAMLEVVGSNPDLAKQRIKFLGLLHVRLPARVGQ